ncbi:hypothetical protein QF002_005616 [Paraburkholderia youngii]
MNDARADVVGGQRKRRASHASVRQPGSQQ